MSQHDISSAEGFSTNITIHLDSCAILAKLTTDCLTKCICTVSACTAILFHSSRSDDWDGGGGLGSVGLWWWWWWWWWWRWWWLLGRLERFKSEDMGHYYLALVALKVRMAVAMALSGYDGGGGGGGGGVCIVLTARAV